jgi:hypothetical protein
MLARGVPMALAAACRRAHAPRASAASRRCARAAAAAPPPPPPPPVPGRAPRRLTTAAPRTLSTTTAGASINAAGATTAGAATAAPARKGPTFQQAVSRLQEFWASVGCAVYLPHNTEVGAGTMNPATFLRVLGPEPWNVAYPEPSIRPDDSRYGDNPNRVQRHTQFQARPAQACVCVTAARAAGAHAGRCADPPRARTRACHADPHAPPHAQSPIRGVHAHAHMHTHEHARARSASSDSRATPHATSRSGDSQA